jgi:hypothetical protein
MIGLSQRSLTTLYELIVDDFAHAIPLYPKITPSTDPSTINFNQSSQPILLKIFSSWADKN